MRAAAIVAGVIIYLAAFPAQATKLSGKVIVTPELKEEISKLERKQAESNRTYYWNEPNGIIPVRSLRINPATDIALVIFQEGALEPKPDELFTVKVHAGAMERKVVVTRPGSTVRFRNVDPFDHELYSPKIAGFKPERQSNGAFRPIQFTQEGVFEVRCKLMPHFKAHVVVTKATFIPEVEANGAFLLSDFKPGAYTVKVFYNGKWIHKQSFKIANQREVKLEVKLSSMASGKG